MCVCARVRVDFLLFVVVFSLPEMVNEVEYNACIVCIMSTCMIYNYCVYRSTVSARLCLVVPFCCYMCNGYTNVI